MYHKPLVRGDIASAESAPISAQELRQTNEATTHTRGTLCFGTSPPIGHLNLLGRKFPQSLGVFVQGFPQFRQNLIEFRSFPERYGLGTQFVDTVGESQSESQGEVRSGCAEEYCKQG